jgi:5-methyltetrahydrofolate--homocysteine methyltransferase
MTSFETLKQAVIEGDDVTTVALTRTALGEGANPADIVNQGLQPGLIIVGERFSSGEFFIPEMLLAARAVSRALDILRPLITDARSVTIGRVVLGTVAGDIHDIGKNLVGMLLQGAGFEVMDLGTNVPPEKFVAAVRENCPDILGLSALLTTTMPAMKAAIEAIAAAGVRDQVKIVVGGAPVTQHFAERIGADGYGADGGAAIEVCRRLMGK